MRMNPAITIELQFFLISILWGAILLATYDILRIFRRIVTHDSFFIAVEDMVFWVIASLFIFAMIYHENNGTIRGFSIMGMLLGSIVYHYSISDLIVAWVVKLIHILLRPLTILLQWIRNILRRLKAATGKVRNRLLLQLKKQWNSVKIKLSNRTQIRREKMLQLQKQKKQQKLQQKQSKEQRQQKQQKQVQKQQEQEQKHRQQVQKQEPEKRVASGQKKRKPGKQKASV